VVLTVYDFTANACSAVWVTGNGQLPCPGTVIENQDYIYPISVPQLEDGLLGQPGLLTVLQGGENDTLLGSYPPVAVKSGDRIQGVISCQYGAPQCDIVFQMNYQVGDEPIKTLLVAHESYDGATTRIDVDLSSLAGKNVRFLFVLFANGASLDDRGIWSGLKIVHLGTASIPFTLTTSAVISLPISPFISIEALKFKETSIFAQELLDFSDQ
jgi:hypothetical protein